MGSFQVWTQQETSQFGQKDERKILIELSFLDYLAIQKLYYYLSRNTDFASVRIQNFMSSFAKGR